jgi:hypothetical protein
MAEAMRTPAAERLPIEKVSGLQQRREGQSMQIVEVLFVGDVSRGSITIS